MVTWYQNSFIIFVISLIILSITFYLFRIGYVPEVQNGKVVNRFSWRYPLAISLVIGLIWYLYIYPPNNINKVRTHTEISSQKINMENWT
jgi:hypothetical protein